MATTIHMEDACTARRMYNNRCWPHATGRMHFGVLQTRAAVTMTGAFQVLSGTFRSTPYTTVTVLQDWQWDIEYPLLLYTTHLLNELLP
jgi:hypothetical protein